MSRADRPSAVHRWVRRPLWWAAAAVALAGGLFVADVGAARSDERTYDRGHRVTGEVPPGWDGGRDVPVAYRHPATGEVVHAATYVWDESRLPAGPGPVALEVSRSDPQVVVIAGDRFPATANLANYAPWTLLPFLVWGVRRWTLRRTERLMASDAVAYLMSASASAPGWWGRRWRLHLYPLDCGPAGRSVCTVPLVDAPSRLGTFTVEVKGAPRPYAPVVARDADGEVLWPSGRALRAYGRPAAAVARMAPTTAPKAARWLAFGGVALLVAGGMAVNAGTFADDVRERQEGVTATVTGVHTRADGRVDVSISYRWAGTRYAGVVVEADAPEEGSSLGVRVDPQSPARVWSVTQDLPPGTHEGEVGGSVMLVALGLLAGAGAVRLQGGRRPSGSQAERAWRGLELVDGRLWYGRQARGLQRARARFDADAFVLVDPDGHEVAFAWDDHANASAPPAASTWHLQGNPPSRCNIAAVWLYAGSAGFTTSRRLAGTGYGDILWDELPVLAAYLAATPRARPGLADPGRVASLIGELAARRWRRPRPPGEPLLGDRLDLHLAVNAVLDRHMRRFGGRPIRGEATPPMEQLVAEVIARLPDWVRPRVTPETVAERLRRHLSTGPWPFDVLLPDDLADEEQRAG